MGGVCLALNTITFLFKKYDFIRKKIAYFLTVINPQINHHKTKTLNQLFIRFHPKPNPNPNNPNFSFMCIGIGRGCICRFQFWLVIEARNKFLKRKKWGFQVQLVIVILYLVFIIHPTHIIKQRFFVLLLNTHIQLRLIFTFLTTTEKHLLLLLRISKLLLFNLMKELAPMRYHFCDLLCFLSITCCHIILALTFHKTSYLYFNQQAY